MRLGFASQSEGIPVGMTDIVTLAMTVLAGKSATTAEADAMVRRGLALAWKSAANPTRIVSMTTVSQPVSV
jgi:hypothetical protein